MNVTMRWSTRCPRHQARVEAKLDDLEQFTLFIGVETGFLYVRVGIVGANAEHDVGLRPIHDERAESVTGQWYGCIGDVVEVDEVRTEVFKWKEVVGRDGKDLPYAIAEPVSEFLLYPEFADNQVFFAVGCGTRVEGPVLCK